MWAIAEMELQQKKNTIIIITANVLGTNNHNAWGALVIKQTFGLGDV
jgi:hypothetical protein